MIHLLLMLAVVGFLAWLILTYIPMPEPFKKALVVILVVVVVLYVLRVLGIGDLPVPQVR